MNKGDFIYTQLAKDAKQRKIIMDQINKEIEEMREEQESCESIMISKWPEANEDLIDPDIERRMEIIFEVITGVRKMRNNLNIPPSEKVNASLILSNHNEETITDIKNHNEVILSMAKLNKFNIINEKENDYVLMSSISVGELYLFLEGSFKEKRKEIINSKLKKVNKKLDELNKKLSNKMFITKAPKNIVEEKKKELKELQDIKDKLEKELV